MGKRLRDLTSAENIDKNFTYLLVDSEGFDEGEKVLLKDISLNDFNQGNFYSKDQINGNFVKVQPNKDLSSNDFTDEYIEQINQKATKKELEQVKNIAEGATQAIVFSDYEELVEVFLKAKKGEYKSGQNILIAQLDVPDLWIAGYSDFIYQNTTAEQFTNDIQSLSNHTGYAVFIGNYGFSPLESQKVDLTDYVKNTDYATKSNVGLVKPNASYGITVNETNGVMSIVRAEENIINAKTDGYRPLTSKFLDYAIKVGLTTNKEEWTEDDKANARTLIDAVGIISDVNRVYATNYQGVLNPIYYTDSATGATIVRRDSNGCAKFGVPTEDAHAANKKYVDSKELNYELIDEITVEEAVNQVSIPLGSGRKSVKIYIKTPTVATSGSAVFTSNGLNLALVPTGAFNSTQAREILIEIDVVNGLGIISKCKYSTNNLALSNETTSFNDETCEPFESLNFVRSSTIEVGTIIKIWANK